MRESEERVKKIDVSMSVAEARVGSDCSHVKGKIPGAAKIKLCAQLLTQGVV